MTQLSHRAAAERRAIIGAEVKSWGCTRSFHPCPGPFTHLGPYPPESCFRVLTGMQVGSTAEPEGRESLCFLEANTGVWREPVNTNGYRISEVNVLGENKQSFGQSPKVLNHPLESPEQPKLAFFTVIYD